SFRRPGGSMRSCCFGAAALTLLVLSSASRADERALAFARPPLETWQIEVMPYAWLAGATGDVTTQSQTVSLDPSFINTVSSNQNVLGLMLAGEARKGDFAIYLDAIYGRYKYSGSTLSGVSLAAGLSVGAPGESGVKYTIGMVEAGVS